MISIKMADGSRYDTDQWIKTEDKSLWPVVQCDGKTVYLNPEYIVSISTKDDGKQS